MGFDFAKTKHKNTNFLPLIHLLYLEKATFATILSPTVSVSMEVFRDIISLGKYLSAQKCQGNAIGLVPTMGALHRGHLSLLERAMGENDIVISSIYVNPTQFNNSEDLKKYPRQEDQDLAMLEKAGCHAVFVPTDDIMYTGDPVVQITFGEMDRVMEGEFRPGHFNGVAMVVSKLFNAVQPDRAYFGQKDLQQFLIIQQLVKDLGFQTELVRVPIFREENGLAMSSRNLHLSDEERETASHIYQMLKEADLKLSNGESWGDVQAYGMQYLRRYGLTPDYFEAVHAETLVRVANDFTGNKVALCVAAFVGNIRLIDNLILGGS